MLNIPLNALSSILVHIQADSYTSTSHTTSDRSHGNSILVLPDTRSKAASTGWDKAVEHLDWLAVVVQLRLLLQLLLLLHLLLLLKLLLLLVGVRHIELRMGVYMLGELLMQMEVGMRGSPLPGSCRLIEHVVVQCSYRLVGWQWTWWVVDE